MLIGLVCLFVSLHIWTINENSDGKIWNEINSNLKAQSLSLYISYKWWWIQLWWCVEFLKFISDSFRHGFSNDERLHFFTMILCVFVLFFFVYPIEWLLHVLVLNIVAVFYYYYFKWFSCNANIHKIVYVCAIK